MHGCCTTELRGRAGAGIGCAQRKCACAVFSLKSAIDMMRDIKRPLDEAELQRLVCTAMTGFKAALPVQKEAVAYLIPAVDMLRSTQRPLQELDVELQLHAAIENAILASLKQHNITCAMVESDCERVLVHRLDVNSYAKQVEEFSSNLNVTLRHEYRNTYRILRPS